MQLALLFLSSVMASMTMAAPQFTLPVSTTYYGVRAQLVPSHGKMLIVHPLDMHAKRRQRQLLLGGTESSLP